MAKDFFKKQCCPLACSTDAVNVLFHIIIIMEQFQLKWDNAVFERRNNIFLLQMLQCVTKAEFKSN